jgi:hypothetical protein
MLPPSPRYYYSALPQNNIIKWFDIVLTEFRGGGVVGGDSITAVVLSVVFSLSKLLLNSVHL